ncbi:FliM/FliN family flagellar motor C-terminal domain-containing protein [bacterium]|nr:FliM/FliN family flagellar motor C-terminal domain-containing protein [bacterium]
MGIEKYERVHGEEGVSGSAESVPRSSPEETPLEFLNDVALPLAVEFGETTLSVGELLKLRKGSVITLDRREDEPATLRVSGKMVALGELVIVNDSYGIRVTSVVEPDFYEEMGGD